MTREEAIKVLNMVEAHGIADEAKRMAIEALEKSDDSKSFSDSAEPSKVDYRTDKSANIGTEVNDLISRADAIEALRKKLQDWGSYAFEDYRRGLYEAQDTIEALPSADTVPFDVQLQSTREVIDRFAEDRTKVVRCKDCKHYGMGNCYMYGGQMNADDYCSRGVKTEAKE